MLLFYESSYTAVLLLSPSFSQATQVDGLRFARCGVGQPQGPILSVSLMRPGVQTHLVPRAPGRGVARAAPIEALLPRAVLAVLPGTGTVARALAASPRGPRAETHFM